MDTPAGVTQQEEGHTGFLHLPFAVLTSIFIARRIKPLSLVDRKVVFWLLQPWSQDKQKQKIKTKDNHIHTSYD